MSCLVPDLNVYEAIYNKAWLYGFNKTVDINYCNCLSFDDEEKLKEHVKNWLYLNELSYNRRYKEESETFLKDFLTFRGAHAIDTYQMLKFLQCIQYNIELETIKSGFDGMQKKIILSENLMNSYNLLTFAVEEISQRIISEIPAYKKAEWANL